ncbi:MAG TPA: sigma-70 family RNA polymerase sigma factor [Phycisphaerae bacterium]|nr:sigma-70 family RNA polymerase sigma factor [Phycisphaerae bacterium]
MNESVRALSAAIASGNTEAFARLFRHRFDDMYAEARRATGRDEAFCLDVVQDAMLRVIRRMKPIDSEQHLRTWLRVVVQSCAYDRLRKEARRRRWEQTSAEARRDESAPDARSEQLKWLRNELANLDEPHTRLLVLRYRLGWTLQRIGAAVGLSPSAVDGRLGRLVTTLRRRAKETFND